LCPNITINWAGFEPSIVVLIAIIVWEVGSLGSIMIAVSILISNKRLIAMGILLL